MSGSPDLVLAAFHWLEYLGLLGGIGSFVVRRVGRFTPRVEWANPPIHFAFGTAVVGGAGLLVFQPSWWLVPRVIAEAIALILCLRGVMFVAPIALLAAALLPFTSRAVAVQPPAGAVFVDVVHVVSAGMWAGGILALASLRPPGGWAGDEARVLLERFGRVAVIAFGITALSGVLRATEQLGGPSDLWSTSYGAVLLLKSIGVVAMLALSSLGWRRGEAIAKSEAATTVVVVGLTALLAAFPVQA